ncbi:MAG: exodeoxyribonuclease VII small subunit [Chitinophagaceae bacterium]
MKKKLSYSQAFAELELLVEQLEDGGIQLEDLALKIRQANGLIEICEDKLRKINKDANEAVKPETVKDKK